MAAHSYLIDMHIHLRDRSPCSHLGFDQLYEQVVDRLYGVCLTDHFVLEPLSLKYGGILKVFFGVELTCESGDVLAYGLSDVPSRGLSLHDLIEAIHHQGGIAVAAHPFDPMRLAIKEDVYNYPFDAI
jgi:predicted metal-dependent phosphoesterase TrpH